MGSTQRWVLLQWALLIWMKQGGVGVHCQLNGPVPCADLGRICSSFLYYTLPSNQSKAVVEVLFGASLSDITEDPNNKAVESEGLFIQSNCSCSSSSSFSNLNSSLNSNSSSKSNSSVYLATTFYNASLSMPLGSILRRDYEGLGWAPNESVIAIAGSQVPISLLCSCPETAWTFILSYVVQPRDTLATLAHRFLSSVQAIADINNVTDENVIEIGRVYYIPINTVSFNTPPAIVPVSSPPPLALSIESSSDGSGGFSLRFIFLIAGGGLGLVIIAAIIVFYIQRSWGFHSHDDITSRCDSREYMDSKCLLCWNNSCHFDHCLKDNESNKMSSKQHVNFSREMMSGVLENEKPVVFEYEEVLFATDQFKESNKLGQGAFGSVYYGVLREQEVAIKRIKALITKEFVGEIKLLCKVHHSNLVELIGYASIDDDLFLIYEYAENRAVADRLHDPVSKGYTPLSWNSRVQIALDTARGLEYIHEHTRAHYVHRDVKTSNILLDRDYRAKVADYGLAKLMEKTSGGETSVTRIVGTFGYLAPEYLRDGQATAKSDVYAFGVVLFELITGQEAIAKSRTAMPSTPERRSLITIMLLALRDSPSQSHMERLLQHVDANLMDLYPRDCLYKMARLAQQCVEEDPVLRPDMKYVVFTLSQILLSSIEWEATLAGNSQVFSRLVQGR